MRSGKRGCSSCLEYDEFRRAISSDVGDDAHNRRYRVYCIRFIHARAAVPHTSARLASNVNARPRIYYVGALDPVVIRCRLWSNVSAIEQIGSSRKRWPHGDEGIADHKKDRRMLAEPTHCIRQYNGRTHFRWRSRYLWPR